MKKIAIYPGSFETNQSAFLSKTKAHNYYSLAEKVLQRIPEQVNFKEMDFQSKLGCAECKSLLGCFEEANALFEGLLEIA